VKKIALKPPQRTQGSTQGTHWGILYYRPLNSEMGEITLSVIFAQT